MFKKIQTGARDAVYSRRVGPEDKVGMGENYEPLFRYLDKRYADSVVLTFDQIESLIGFPLSASARADLTWWSNDESPAWPLAQSRAWTRASRRATPNLGARIVRFDRNAD